MAGRSLDTAWPADLWNASTSYSRELDGRLGRVAFSLGTPRLRGAGDMAVQCVATALLGSMVKPKPLRISRGRRGRPRCLCAWQLDARAMGAATALDLSDGRDDLADVRSSGGESSG